MIKIKDLKKSFDGHEVLKGISFEVGKGEVFALVGGSGGGKSVLLKHVAGLMKPDGGSVTVDGLEIGTAGNVALQSFRERLGFLFQGGALFASLTVFDNVAFPLREQTQLSEGLIQNLVMMKLQAVGLRNASQLMPSELSGGMARRVALARSMALEPSIIMYDEPFTGQDPISMGVLVKLIRELTDAMGVTSVVVSHDVAEVMSIADHVVILSAGEVVAQGSPDELETLGSPWVKQFIHGEPDGPVPFHMAGRDYSEDLVAQ